MKIKEINELLTKAFQQECCLEDNLKSFYTLKFLAISSIMKFEEVKNNCERFLSQYDIKTGAGTMLYSKEAGKVFVLQVHKLPFDKLLEKLTALMKDVQLHEAANKGNIESVKRFLDNGANIDSKNIFGDTLRNVAARRGHNGINDVFLDQSSDVSKCDPVKDLVCSFDQEAEKGGSLIKVLADKPVNQVIVEETEEMQGAQRRSLIDFFPSVSRISSADSVDADESQTAKKSATHLTK